MLPSEEEIEIGPAEAATWIREASADVRLVDCREEDEFDYCRIDNAELIPLSRFAEESARRLNPHGTSGDERPIIVYCHHGMRSMNATLFLRQKGHRRVWSLRGGIEAWSLEIDPTVPRY